MKRYVAAVVLILAVLFALLPLFGNRYIPTHDGEYHIIRIIEFSKMLRAGYWFPRWAPDLNSGYGIPIFEFHYPFPNYVAAIVRSVTHDAVRAFQASVGLGYLTASVFLFGWLAMLFGFFPAAVGTTVGMFVPYWFVNMYVRGSIGEIWATAFLFAFLFLTEKKRHLCAAVSYGLLIISHNILAMVYTPLILAYIFIRDRRVMWPVIAGIGISAYFWLPAIFESKYVVGLNTVNFREHFVQLYELIIPSWGTQFSGIGSVGNKISFQIGVIPLVSYLLGFIIARKNGNMRLLWRVMYITFGLSVLLMLSFSGVFWKLVTPLQYIQYPWRLLSFVIPTAAFAAAFWAAHTINKKFSLALMVCAVLFTVFYMRPVLYEPRNEAYYLSQANFTGGTSSMGNSFSTIWTGWKEYRPASDVYIQNGMVTNRIKNMYLDKRYTVIMDKEGEALFNTLYFPGWKAFVDGGSVPIRFEKDGIIRFNVPAGIHTIRIRYTETPLRMFGDILSVGSLVVLLTSGILRIRRRSTT